MNKLYLIPDYRNLEESMLFIEQQKANCEYNDFFLPVVLDDRRRQLEMIDAYAKVRSDFSQDTLHGAFLDITLHSTDPLIRQASELRVRQSMEIAREMGLRAAVFHTNRLYGFKDPSYLANFKKANAAFFRSLAEEFPAQEIFLENMFDEAPDVLAELASELADCPNFGICLDYAHSAVFGGEAESWLEALAPYIRHMHINDNDLKEDLHQPVGTGRICWPRFTQQMKKYHINATVLVEVGGLKKQRKSIAYMKEHSIYPFAETGR